MATIIGPSPLNSSERLRLQKARAIALGIKGVTVELCGHFLWVHGAKREHRFILCPAQKEQGQIRFKWHKTKGLWYYSPRPFFKRSKEELGMDEIRMNYGSYVLNRRTV